MPNPVRGERAKKNTAKKMNKATAMPGANGKAKAPTKSKPKVDPLKAKKKTVAMSGGKGKQKKKNA